MLERDHHRWVAREKSKEQAMRTRFLVQASHCYEVDPQRISEAGGRLVGIGRLEDDGTCTVDIDVRDEDRESSRRLSALLGGISATHPHR
jgi:hypothetical protein